MKSHAYIFLSRNIPYCRQGTLNYVKIPLQTSVKHHRNYLNNGRSDETDIGNKLGDSIVVVKLLNSIFSTVKCDVKWNLLQTYCTAWYGWQAWQLGITLTDKMNVEWRKAVCRTVGLPGTFGVFYFQAWLGMKIFIFMTKDVLKIFFTPFYLAATMRPASLPRRHFTI